MTDRKKDAPPDGQPDGQESARHSTSPDPTAIGVSAGGGGGDSATSNLLSPPLKAKSLRLLYEILAYFDSNITKEDLAWILPILERHYKIGPEHMVKWNKMSTMQGYKNFHNRFHGRDAFADGPFQERFRLAMASHYLHRQRHDHVEWNAFFFAAAVMGSFLSVPDLNKRTALFVDWLVNHWQAWQLEKIWTDHHIRFINTLIGFANVRAYGLTPGITRLLRVPEVNDSRSPPSPRNGSLILEKKDVEQLENEVMGKDSEDKTITKITTHQEAEGFLDDPFENHSPSGSRKLAVEDVEDAMVIGAQQASSTPVRAKLRESKDRLTPINRRNPRARRPPSFFDPYKKGALKETGLKKIALKEAALKKCPGYDDMPSTLGTNHDQLEAHPSESKRRREDTEQANNDYESDAFGDDMSVDPSSDNRGQIEVVAQK